MYTIALTSFCLYRFFKYRFGAINDNGISIDIRTAAIVLVFFLVIGMYCGWGRFTDQSGDWTKHNAVLYDLVNRGWPVYYHNGNERSMLSYYIAQYIVPAAIGKVFGSCRAAEISLYLWNTIGLVLVYLHLIVYLNIKDSYIQIISALLLIFFSMPLWAEQILVKLLSDVPIQFSSHWLISNDNLRLQYSSNFVMLRWVFPQCIPIWMMILMFLDNREHIEYYLLILLPGMLFATLSFIGVIPIGIAAATEYLLTKKDLKDTLKHVFSVENICMLMGVGAILALYLYGNVLSEKPAGVGFHIYNYINIDNGWIYYLTFISGPLVYALILFSENRKNLVYYAAVLTLCILPFFSMGIWNDFVMRSSIPALFILFVYTIKFISQHFYKAEKLYAKALLTAVLMIGFYYPTQELFKAVEADSFALGKETDPKSLKSYADRGREDVGNDLIYNYYAYDIEDNVFYKYVARRK